MANQPYPTTGGIFQGYHPPSYQPNPHRPVRVPPLPQPVEIPESVKKAAIKAGASHISADGKTAFVLRMGKVCRSHWDGVRFESWWATEEEVLPCGVVELK